MELTIAHPRGHTPPVSILMHEPENRTADKVPLPHGIHTADSKL